MMQRYCCFTLDVNVHKSGANMSWELNLLLRLLLLKIYCICVSQGSSLPESYPDPTTEGANVLTPPHFSQRLCQQKVPDSERAKFFFVSGH